MMLAFGKQENATGAQAVRRRGTREAPSAGDIKNTKTLWQKRHFQGHEFAGGRYHHRPKRADRRAQGVNGQKKSAAEIICCG